MIIMWFLEAPGMKHCRAGKIELLNFLLALQLKQTLVLIVLQQGEKSQIVSVKVEN